MRINLINQVKTIVTGLGFFKSKYKLLDTASLSYEQKTIGRNFQVEGASQTKDKVTHELDFVYKPQKIKVWYPSAFSVKFKPETTGRDGDGSTKKHFRTFQTVTDFKLPQDAKYTYDYKYYWEKDKCGCSYYRTVTHKHNLNWYVPFLKTTLKPQYTFERKDDLVNSPTDEKRKEFQFVLENKYIENLTLNYTFEREKKKYSGLTTKSYKQYVNTFEAKYTFIPSRLDSKIKFSNDYKNPSDTNKTSITTATFELNYTTKDRNNKFNLKYERKNNIYLPWSESSAYRQNYTKLKYTRVF